MKIQPTDVPVVKPVKVIWLTLPNSEPGVLVCLLDVLGEKTYDLDEAEYVIAQDRYRRFWRFYPQENTFDSPRLT